MSNNHEKHEPNVLLFIMEYQFSPVSRNTMLQNNALTTFWWSNPTSIYMTLASVVLHYMLKLQATFCQISPELCHFQLLSDFILPRTVIMKACIPWHLVTHGHTTPTATIFLIFWANPKSLISNLPIHSINISFVGE